MQGTLAAAQQLTSALKFFGFCGKFWSEKVDVSKVEALIAARLVARATKNWAESDRIRDELVAMGIAIKDNKDGTTTWEVKR